MKPHPFRRRLAALLLGSVLPAVAADFTSTWNSTTGNWSDPTKWSTNPVFPNNGVNTFDAIQNGGSLTVDTPITIEKFTLNAGNLQGAQTLTLNDLFTFSSGTLSNAGTVNANGGALFDTGGTKTIQTSRVLNIGDGIGAAGSVTASHTGGLFNISNGSALNVKADAAFTTNFDGVIQGTGAAAASAMTIEAGGSFTKNGGSGTTTIGIGGTATLFFHNSGTVNVQTGTLQIGSGSLANVHTGAFNISSGATLNLSGTHTLNSTASFTGTGTALISGTVNATGTHAVAAPLTLTGILQSTGTVNASNAVTWSSGLMASAGTTNILSSLALDTASTKTLETGRVLNIGDGVGAAGSVTASHTAGVFAINGGATMNVKADGAFTTDFDGAMNNTGAGAPGVLNVQAGGSFTKSGGSGTTSIGTGGNGNLLFHNSGTVSVQTGTLHIGKGALANIHTGNFDLSSGTTLNLAGTHTLNTGASFTGAAGTLVMSGTVNANTTVGTPMALTLTGTLQGGGTVNAAGAVTWSSGLMASTGTMNILSSIALDTTSTKTLETGRVLNIGDGAGATGSVTASHTGGMLAINGGSTLNVKADGAFTTNFDGTIQNTGAGAPSAMNIQSGGSFTKNGGTGSTIIGGGTGTLNFSNAGTVHVATGTLAMGSSGTLAYNQSGPDSFTILESGTVLATSSLNLNGGTLKGTGTVQGSVIAGAGVNTIDPGFSPGVLTVNGNVTLSSTSTLAMEIGGLTQGTLYDYLDVNGTLTLAGLLNLSFLNDFQNSLGMGNLFTLATSDAAVLGGFSNVANGGFLTDMASLHTFSVHYGAGSLYNPNDVVLYAVTPEPGRALLLMLGLLGLTQRRKRHACAVDSASV